jgi:N-acetylglutamate synthase-like GNAT family acetyltransferase
VAPPIVLVARARDDAAQLERAAARARELGAQRLYVSATESENTVDFYLRRGCRLAEEVDPALFALEPNDIHLELDLTAGGTPT